MSENPNNKIIINILNPNLIDFSQKRFNINLNRVAFIFLVILFFIILFIPCIDSFILDLWQYMVFYTTKFNKNIKTILSKINKTGKMIINKYKNNNYEIDTINYRNKNNFILYFPKTG